MGEKDKKISKKIDIVSQRRRVGWNWINVPHLAINNLRGKLPRLVLLRGKKQPQFKFSVTQHFDIMY